MRARYVSEMRARSSVPEISRLPYGCELSTCTTEQQEIRGWRFAPKCEKVSNTLLRALVDTHGKSHACMRRCTLLATCTESFVALLP